MVLFSRRAALLGAAAAVLVPAPARALTEAEALALVHQAVAEINAILTAGGPEGTIISKFAAFYNRYADKPTIAAAILGPPARQASTAQRSAFSKALENYLIYKYGRRYGEMTGGQVDVLGAEPAGSNRVAVRSVVKLRGRAPFDLTFFISDAAGRPLFYDMRLEGISMLRQEAAEINALYERNGRDLNRLITALGG